VFPIKTGGPATVASFAVDLGNAAVVGATGGITVGTWGGGGGGTAICGPGTTGGGTAI